LPPDLVDRPAGVRFFEDGHDLGFREFGLAHEHP
jgi:hypothetical protein